MADALGKKRRRGSSIASGRWVTYAAAGVASTVTLASSSEAEVHYSGMVNERLDYHHGRDRAGLPLSGGASLYFFEYSHARFPSYNRAGFAIFGAEFSHQVRAHHSRYGQGRASNLNLGQPVSSGYFREVSSQFDYDYNILTFYGKGSFKSGGFGLVGFKFNTGAGPQYGWARIRTHGYPRSTFVVTDYAWTDPGEPIAAGQRRASVPASASLGSLALGAAGLPLWRAQWTEEAARP